MPDSRFLLLSDVAEVLNISAAQTYALVRSGELPAVKIGGRGQWRVERRQLEAYIERAYERTRDYIASHPYGRGDDEGDEDDVTATTAASGTVTEPRTADGRRGSSSG